MSSPKRWVLTKDTSKDEDLKTVLFNTKRHLQTDREIKTPVTKRNTGVEKPTIKKSIKSKNE